jgi:hypothetical protein
MNNLEYQLKKHREGILYMMKYPNIIDNTFNKGVKPSSIITVWSSFLFIPTAIYSYFRGCYQITGGCIGCFITALAYHGFHNVIGKTTTSVVVLREIDRVFNHLCIIYFSYKCVDFSWNFIVAMGGILYMLVGFYVLDKSSNCDYGRYFHVTIHLVANFGIVMIIEACYHSRHCFICQYPL